MGIHPRAAYRRSKIHGVGFRGEAARAFVGVAPMDVDINCAGFLGATPLLELPHRACAAYLGPYLLALLSSIEDQRVMGTFGDIVTRAHIITGLESPCFVAVGVPR